MALGRIHVAVVALAAGAALAVVACADVLGIQDRSLDPLAGGGDGGSSSGGDGGPACADPCAMATGLNHPFAMTVDETNVYWTEYGDSTDDNGSVKACPVTGCGAGPTVYAALQAAPRGIAVDATNVYWGTAAGPSGTGAIWSCAIGGCNGKPTKIAVADTPFGVAVDAQNVYWAEFFQETINRAAKAGGSTGLVYDGGAPSGAPNGPSILVVDSQFVYFNDQNVDVYRVALGGGSLIPMYTDPNGTVLGAFGLAVDSKDAYIGSVGGIFQMSKSATSGATTLAPNVTDVVDLKVDPAGGVLYWADFGMVGTDGTVGKVALDGSAPVLLHQQLVTPEALGVNSANVFWISNGTVMSDGTTVASNTGTLYRTTK
jgi:hypothetical protein